MSISFMEVKLKPEDGGIPLPSSGFVFLSSPTLRQSALQQSAHLRLADGHVIFQPPIYRR
jgi:hypothetical protein